jgi:hypothetical protein
MPSVLSVLLLGVLLANSSVFKLTVKLPAARPLPATVTSTCKQHKLSSANIKVLELFPAWSRHASLLHGHCITCCVAFSCNSAQ